MKKLTLGLLVIMLASLSVNAQKESSGNGFKFGVGAVIGLPVGTFSRVESIAYEAGIQAEFSETATVGITGSLGYMKVAGKNGVKINGALVPLLAGAKFYLKKNIYLHTQIGISFATADGGGNALTYSPSFGGQLSQHIDVSVRYWAATKNSVTESYVGLRLGFTF